MPRLATLPRQLLWFMLVGALSTVLQTLVYVSVRFAVPATWASWIALLAITPLNTEAHRRVTFNVKTSAVGRLHWEAGLTSVAVYLANLVVAPRFAGIAGPHPTSLEEALILALTGSLIGGLRYVLLRGWVFAQHRHQAPAQPGNRPAGRDRQTAEHRESQPAAAPHAPGSPGSTPAKVHRAGLRLLRRRGRQCLAAAGSSLRTARRSPAGRRSSAPDQRPANTR
ncbi:putative flippase GtrA [Actinoplanes lutulentus]|uniref:GtrA-like protein n=1 Tax=Actinoplanes lutulentus TaxID=1287878 RepID=A0A327ZH35_9ACTN|nr:putative flippase GtrA [Actinoplanes lutulentus]RAK36864.1 GtrA-like protein [Actinoplanes lutulentus]